MTNKTPSTWGSTLLFVGGLAAVGPLCYLLWFGAVALVDGEPSIDAWLQSAANIVGAVLSGGVAAVVAVLILKHEQREREAQQKESAANTVEILNYWIENVAVEIEKETTATVKIFPNNDQKIIGARITVLVGLHMSPAMQARVSQTHADLLPGILEISDLLRSFEQPLVRSGTLERISDFDSRPVYISALDRDDIKAICVLPDKFANAILRLGNKESAALPKSIDAARRLFRATDSLVAIVRGPLGIEVDDSYVAHRPPWYSPT